MYNQEPLCAFGVLDFLGFELFFYILIYDVIENHSKKYVDRRYSKKDCINLVQYFITPYNKRIILTTKHTSCSRAYALDGLQITTTQYDVRSNIFKTTTLSSLLYLRVSSLEDYYYYLCTMHIGQNYYEHRNARELFNDHTALFIQKCSKLGVRPTCCCAKACNL